MRSQTVCSLQEMERMEAAVRRSARARKVTDEVSVKTDILALAAALFTKNDRHRHWISVETSDHIDDEWRKNFKVHVHGSFRTYSTDKVTNEEHFTGWCISGIAESHTHRKCGAQLFVNLNENNVLVGTIVLRDIPPP